MPLWIEWLRRPKLTLTPVPPDPDAHWTLVHLRAENTGMADRGRVARFFGRFVTALAADGCVVTIQITGGSLSKPLAFSGKWSSKQEPVTRLLQADGKGGFEVTTEYDPQKLVGIHEVSLQPGRSGEQVAVAIRAGGKPAFAFDAEPVYRANPFPEAATCELLPGTYCVEAQARAGEVASAAYVYELKVPNGGGLRLSPG